MAIFRASYLTLFVSSCIFWYCFHVSSYFEWQAWGWSNPVGISLGHHLWFMHGVVVVWQSLSSHCMDERWSWGTIQWKLNCNIRMSLYELVHLGRLLHYYFLMLWIRSMVFIEFTWPISIFTPCRLSYTYINHIVDFSGTIPIKFSLKYFMYIFGITGDNGKPIGIHTGIYQTRVGRMLSAHRTSTF